MRVALWFGIALLLLAGLGAAAPAAAQAPAGEWPPAALPRLPVFLLPYDSAQQTVVWTGGPHPYNQGGNLDGQYRYGEGSGMDFAAVDGGSFAVLAMAAGTVIESGCGYEGLGCIVAVRHDEGGTVMIYGHLQPDSLIEAGGSVAQGAVLGAAGSSGGQAHTHLHIELRDGGACAADLHAQCGDIGWAGNPVGWERGLLFVDGYRISGYCVARTDSAAANCFELPTARYYAYEGAAFRGASATTEYDFWYKDVDEANRARLVRAAVVVDPAFGCSGRLDCESFHTTSTMQFAGHGVFGTGGGPNRGDELESTNRAAEAETPAAQRSGAQTAQIALLRDGALYLRNVASGAEQMLVARGDVGDLAPYSLSWSADGTHLAYGTTDGAQGAIHVLEVDAAGRLMNRTVLRVVQPSAPLPAFDPADRDRLIYATVAEDNSGATDLFAFSLSTQIEQLLYSTPPDLPCTAVKLVTLAPDRFVLLHICGTGAGNSLLALEVNRRAGTFEAAWVTDWVDGYAFVDQPAACAGAAPQTLDAAWSPGSATLTLLLGPDCMDMINGGIQSGAEEIVTLGLRADGSATAPQRLMSAEGIVAFDRVGDGDLLLRTADGVLWLLSADGSAMTQVAEDAGPAARRPGGAAGPAALVPVEPTAAQNLVLAATVSASSALPADKYGAYGAAQAADGVLATAWAEGVDGPGVGEYLQFDFAVPVVIDYLLISAGYDSDDAGFKANNRVAALTLELDDGRRIPLTLADQRGLQRLDDWPAPGQGTVTRSARLYIDAVYPGARYDDTCFAEVEIWGEAMEE